MHIHSIMNKSMLLSIATISFVVITNTLAISDITPYDITEHFVWDHFTNFQERFKKRYKNLKITRKRFNIFRTNLINIQQHNKDPSQNFTKGINQFTDWLPNEFNQKKLKKSKNKIPGLYGCNYFIYDKQTELLPDSIDWREKSAVTPVKNQHQCGSCWSFSATGAMEGAWATATGNLVSFSEEQLIDCASGIKYGSYGCNGGQMDGAFKYIIENGAISKNQYPNTAGNGQPSVCEQGNVPSIATFMNCYDVAPNDQVSLKAAVSKQPVSVAIEADARYFQSYSGGIITSNDCGTNLDHGALIIGYGEDKGQKYWLVKNSWSTTWGDNGYVKIARSDNRNDNGVCGIAIQPSFITT